MPPAPITFICSVADDDFAPPLAGFLDGQSGAQALFVLPEPLALPEAVLLHDLVCHGASAGRKRIVYKA